MKFKILYLIIIINFFILKNTILSQTTTNDFIGCNETEGKCTLTESCPVAPKPSLSKCYRYNPISCCKSVHDYYIKESLAALLTFTCLDQFPELTDLFCMFCSPFEPHFNNATEWGNQTRKIKICKTYVENLWGGDIDKPTEKFDKCGFKKDSSIGKITIDSYIKPSKEYKNALDFLNRINIPFLDGIEFDIFDNTEMSSLSEDDDEALLKQCFKDANVLKITFLLIIFVILVFSI